MLTSLTNVVDGSTTIEGTAGLDWEKGGYQVNGDEEVKVVWKNDRENTYIRYWWPIALGGVAPEGA